MSPVRKRYKIRASALVILAIFALSVGTLSVRAYEPCQRFVQKYVEKMAPHSYSKTTLARWSAWGKSHPNYHPPKHAQSLLPKEALDKVNFDCQVIPEPVLVSGLVEPAPLPDLLLPPQVVTLNTTPVLPNRTVSLIDAPAQVPPTSIADTPEPQSWALALTGLIFVGACVFARFRNRQDEIVLSASALA